jgi:hypothetical protein
MHGFFWQRLVNTFANVRRIESLIAALDTGNSYKSDQCENILAHP